MTILKQQQCGIMNIYELVKDSEYMRFAEKYEVPLWIGEFGSQYNAGEEDIRRIIKSFIPKKQKLILKIFFFN